MVALVLKSIPLGDGVVDRRGAAPLYACQTTSSTGMHPVSGRDRGSTGGTWDMAP